MDLCEAGGGHWIDGGGGWLCGLIPLVARRFLADLLSQRVAENGVDLYRNAFNIDNGASGARCRDTRHAGPPAFTIP